MDKIQALEKLNSLIGLDLAVIAKDHNITIWKSDGKQNKGWAGHAVERYLGLPINSLREPNLGSWELKIVPARKLKNGATVLKETMAITMLDPINIFQTPFEESHLYTKMRRIIVGIRMHENNQNASSIFLGHSSFELENPEILKTVKDDYDLVRDRIKNLGVEAGFRSLSAKMGEYIQPRTKGKGHGSTSRAFYAKKNFLNMILSEELNLIKTREHHA